MDAIITLFNEAYDLHQRGDLAKAELLYKKILGINRNNFDAIYLLAKLFAEKNLSGQAVDLLKEAIGMAPNNPQPYILLGHIYNRLEMFSDAVTAYNSALQLAPDNAGTFYAKGIALSELMHYEEALEAFQKAIDLDRTLKEAYSAQGYILHAQNLPNEALLKYQQAALIDPTNPLDLFNVAVILQEQKKYVDALAAYEKILTLDPQSIDALNNKGLIYSAIDQLDIAIDCHKQAIAINPLRPDSHNNLGYLYQELMRFDEALVSYEKAIALQPDYPDARWNRASILLAQGDYENGFLEYEWRLKLHDLNPRKFLCERWNGTQHLKGKTVLIHSEQGLGDAIQFTRYINLIADHAARVIFEVQAPLLSLLDDLPNNVEIILQSSPLPHFDFECPMMSLAMCLKTTLKTIPSPEGYLKANQSLVNSWSIRLGKKKVPRIGIVWSSVSNYPDDRKRSMSLRSFLKCLPDKGFEYICLQKVVKDEDLETLKENPHIHFYGNELNTFQDTAALIECVDLVLSTCTSVPHLSGALGKPTWIVLPFKSDWRWLTQREDSPWYGNTKLYRQESYGDWSGVLHRVRQDLESLTTTSDVEASESN